MGTSISIPSKLFYIILINTHIEFIIWHSNLFEEEERMNERNLEEASVGWGDGSGGRVLGMQTLGPDFVFPAPKWRQHSK